MELGITGKVALVTASSDGIGKQCALTLAGEGAKLVLCARGEERLNAAVKEVGAIAGAENVLGVRADISQEADIKALCEKACATFGRIDILIFIGGSPKRGGFGAVTVDDLRQAFEMTVVAAFRFLSEVLPGMRARKWGRIVTVQARSVREPIPDLVTSVATRPGVAGLFKYVANEAAADGVLVNTIVPGRINTDRFRQGAAMASAGADQYVRNKIAEIPVGRLGEGQEIANAVCFLVSERASYINGAALQVDGGVIKAI
jgi:3-oxoacyl-[acyl-carrier protein] reductase